MTPCCAHLSEAEGGQKGAHRPAARGKTWRDQAADGRLIAVVYKDLRQVARRRFRAERADHSLAATALVHDLDIRKQTAKFLLRAGQSIEARRRLNGAVAGRDTGPRGPVPWCRSR
jgi:ECF sigma factor